MICVHCRKQDHESCPANQSYDEVQDLSGLVLESAAGSKPVMVKKPPTGLDAEGEKIQRSGLCPCQHRRLQHKGE